MAYSLRASRAVDALALLLLVPWAALASGQSLDLRQVVKLNIPAEPLATALLKFSSQTQIQIATSGAEVGRAQSPGVVGPMSLESALSSLLSGTGFGFQVSGERSVAIFLRSPVPSAPLPDVPPSAEPSTKATDSEPDRHGNGTKPASEARVPPRIPPAAPVVLEEIVVTAQKREESLQKADLAITAITGDTLTRLNVTNALDLNQVVPNLAISQTGTGARIAMRGVVTNNDTEVGDPDVAFNVNGIYLGRQRAVLSALYDVDRVEALRGPQGTLYGRNAAAGSLNVITRVPELSHEYASGSIGFGNYSSAELFGLVNLPLSTTFGLRAAVEAARHDGYVATSPSAANYNDQDTVAGRVTALWQPSNNFSAKLYYEQAHDGGVGYGGFGGGGPLGLYLASSGSSPYRWFVRPVDAFTDDTVRSTTVMTDWRGALMSVAYVGNYRTDDWFATGSQAAQGPVATMCQVAVAAPVSDATNCTGFANMSRDRQFSHELRFSKETDRLKSVFGLYYFREHNSIFNGLDPAPGGPAAAGPAYTRTFAFVFPDVIEDSRAAFAQATLSLSKRVRITGGARYTEDHKARTGEFYLSAAAGSVVDFRCIDCAATAFAILPSHADLRWDKTTWKVAIDFDLNPDSMLFGAVATGYKAGGYGDGTPPNNGPYNPENLTNYEIGWKSSFMQRRLQLNIDAFHTLFSDYQATSGIKDPVSGAIAALTVNAGRATIDGIELESIALATDVDRVSLNATWLNARFTNFILPLGDQYVIGGPCDTCRSDLTGNKLPYAPDFTVRLDWQHAFVLTGGAELVTRLDSQYVTSQELEYHNFLATHQPSYTRTGLSISYEPGGKWSLMAYVRNLENKAVLVKGDADNNAPNGDFNHYGKSGYWMAPRTIGVRLAAAF
jgi:iron complex outermembrane receptor protein